MICSMKDIYLINKIPIIAVRGTNCEVMKKDMNSNTLKYTFSTMYFLLADRMPYNRVKWFDTVFPRVVLYLYNFR